MLTKMSKCRPIASRVFYRKHTAASQQLHSLEMQQSIKWTASFNCEGQSVTPPLLARLLVFF